ncbi:MAG: DUF6776 family protein [Halofilum sp. (in: g-proteobacteria)]
MPASRFSSSGFRLRPHRPLRTAVIAVGLTGVTAAALWAAYQHGIRVGGHAAAQARATEAHLRIQVADLRERVQQLRQRNTLLARAERIERDARENLRGVIEARESRIAGLEEELSFYRNIVSPSKMDPGLQIRRVAFSPIAGVERAYRYEVVLSQLNGGERYAAGDVRLSVDGRDAGEPATFDLDEFALGESLTTEFRFKYFQTLTGRIRLPEEFDPGWLQVEVAPDGGRFDPLDETYAWDSLLSEGV